MSKILTLVLVTILCFISVHVGAGPQYTVTQILPCSGVFKFYSYDLNDLGQVVGMAMPNGSTTRAFIWQNGVMEILETPEGDMNSHAHSINNHGQIVGWSGDSEARSTACLWDNGKATSLGTLGGGTSIAYGINDAGQIVGVSKTAKYISHPFIYQNGKMHDLIPPDIGDTIAGTATDINSSGMVVGIYSFTWQNGVFSRFNCTLPDGLSGNSQAVSVNDSGQVVGVWVHKLPTTIRDRGYIWQDGVMQDLGLLPGYDTVYAIDINNKGQVVGATHGSIPSCAFIWENGVMKDLNSMISPGSGWELYSAKAINNFGQIIGSGFYNGIQSEYILTPVPEPSSFIGLLCGLAGIGGAIRRYKGLR